VRFVWAVVAFVLAAVLIGAGIAQRTFVGPDSQETQVEIDESAPFVLLDGDVLRTNPGVQTLIVSGEGDIFGSYGRTADMEAWLADSDYNHVTVDDDGDFVVKHVTASDAPDETDGAEGSGDGGEAAAGRDPRGSDLWLDSFAKKDRLVADNMQLPEGTSMLVAYDGTQDAPDDIVVSWPLDTSTPLAGPLMAAGGVVLLIGLVLYVLGIRHQRRGRGPRRKGPGPLPATEPIDVAVLPAEERAAIEDAADAPKSVDPSQEPSSPAPETEIEDAEIVDPKANDSKTSMRGEKPARRRRLLAIPALGLTALLAAGCSADSWPQLGDASASPTPSPTVIAPENQKPPAVTEAQAKRILQTASETVAEADTALDTDLAATRLAGPALAARTTEYELRTKLTDKAPPAAIPTDDVEVVLPEATDLWPRTVLMLSKSKGDDTVPPVLLTMTQADPWSNYKISNMAEMAAGAVFPEVAATWLGTSLVPSDSAFLAMPPAEVAPAFADVVDAGEKSEFYGQFDELSLSLAQSLLDSRQTIVKGLADKGASKTSKAAFDMAATTDEPISMTTLDSGAIVAVSLTDTETVTPTSSDVVIRFGDNAEAKALTGATESAKGAETTYELQLFFSVPAQGSTEQIRLLAVHQDLVSVKVIK
jgi:hypothetical protein